ncbi:hypothetical protein ABZ769_36435 [Streptomyces olivoreticuli]
MDHFPWRQPGTRHRRLANARAGRLRTTRDRVARVSRAWKGAGDICLCSW